MSKYNMYVMSRKGRQHFFNYIGRGIIEAQIGDATYRIETHLSYVSVSLIDVKTFDLKGEEWATSFFDGEAKPWLTIFSHIMDTSNTTTIRLPLYQGITWDATVENLGCKCTEIVKRTKEERERKSEDDRIRKLVREEWGPAVNHVQTSVARVERVLNHHIDDKTKHKVQRGK